MRIIINVKYRAGQITLETWMNSAAEDKIVELNAGKALFDALNGMLEDMTKPDRKTETGLVEEPADDTQFRCTVCGRIGSVGRCCGLETREPLNDRARAEVLAEEPV